MAAITDGLAPLLSASDSAVISFLARKIFRATSRSQTIKERRRRPMRNIPLRLAAPALGWDCTAGRYWLFGDFVNTGYNHNGTPNDRRPTCGPFIEPAVVGGPGGLDPPRSFHSGAVDVLFGDAHVEPVSSSVSQSLWTALGTYNAGDLE